eukprot:666807-Alexandrium_andersonii.AAC.1
MLRLGPTVTTKQAGGRAGGASREVPGLSDRGRCDRGCDREACDRRPGNTVATGACDRRTLPAK